MFFLTVDEPSLSFSIMLSIFYLAGFFSVIAPIVQSVAIRTPSILPQKYAYVNVAEHCEDLYSFKGTDEAPTVVTNVTYVQYNATDGTPAFCDIQGIIATYNDVTIRLPALGSNWAGIVFQQGCGGPRGYMYMDTYWSDIGGWPWS